MTLDKIITEKDFAGEEGNLIRAVREGIPSSAFSLSQSQKIHLASVFSQTNFLLFVAADFFAAGNAHKQLSMILGGESVAYIAAKDDVLLPVRTLGERLAKRLSGLYGAAAGSIRAAVVEVEGLMHRFPSYDNFVDGIINIRAGGEIAPQTAAAALVKNGYRRDDVAESRGKFSLRGDILDIFPVQSAKPLRLEFFGDTVESIRYYDPATLLSGERTDKVSIAPAADLFNGETFPSGSLADYLPNNTVVFFDETKQIVDALNGQYAEFNGRLKTLFEKERDRGEDAAKQIYPQSEIFSQFDKFRRIACHKITTSNNIFKPAAVFNFKTPPPLRYHNDFAQLAKDIDAWSHNGYRVLICGRDAALCKDIRDRLFEFGKSVGANCIIEQELESGFIWHGGKLAAVGTYDIIAKPKTVIARRRGADVFTEARVGDYVVHSVHGIGRCEGVTRLSGTGAGTKDYVTVAYADGAKLYVPIEQMSSLSRYGGGEHEPKLNKLGGAEFARLKEKVKAAVKKMAFDLLNLYNERKDLKGYKYSEEDELLRAFEDSFPFEETDDQLKCVQDILSDMRQGKIMDRLVCGDVGYGKTEVALRAAFKTITEGRQVAFIAPTSILSQQHFNTCVQRFAPFGVRVEQLNRFAGDKEQAAAVGRLKAGTGDIACGTHRILSKDVEFKNLGLLILDEEQRFGVEDKEKIKNLKKEVNVLTLTATPIPRTLHMSLTGIRDISVLETPPEGRVPVQTYVTEYTDSLLKDAVYREKARGGQVFVVYNRVETIYKFAKNAADILGGDIRISVAHGRMNENELEQQIKDFYDNKTDVLIATTIIENGIDLPNANTMIICDADRLGLAQLYQLRGRVGRSSRFAYAYFTYADGKALTENAYKRLDAVMEFTELGSGFKIAMRDLEIRGAGNVLGAEQHGHMQKVGYDMYCKLLKEAVGELSGRAAGGEERETKLETDLDAYIPQSYIEDDAGRMRLYQRIGALRGLKEREQLIKEVADIYGEPNAAVQNLINSGMIRGLAANIGASRVIMKARAGAVEFDNIKAITENIGKALNEFKGVCVLKAGNLPTIVFETGNIYGNVLKFLHKCQP